MKKYSISIILIGSCLSAWSQNIASAHDMYWGVSLSGMPLRGFSSTLTQNLIQQVGGNASASDVRSVSAFQIFLGRRYSENIDLELGYAQTSAISVNFSGTSSNNVNYAGNLNMNIYAYEASVKLRPNIDTDLNGYYLKLGTHYSRLTNDVQVISGNTQVINNVVYSGWGPSWGLGYDFYLTKDVAIRASFTAYKNIGGSNSGSSGVLDSIGIIKYF